MITVGCGLALMAGQAGAAVAIFQESTTYTADAVTIRNDTPDTNINSNSQVIVGNVNTIILRGLFEFDLSQIEAAAAGNAYTIDSVTLTVTTSSAGGSGGSANQFNLSILGSNSDFDESVVTWNNAPSAAGGTVGTFLTSATFNPTVVSTAQTFANSTAFSSAAANALAGSDNTLRLIMTASIENGGYLTRLNTNENGTPTARPTLTVNYTVVPEPVSGVLVGLGSALMCFSRRRKYSA